MIDYFSSKHKEMDKAIDAHVAAHDELQATVDLLLTMRGCGRILALTLITELPELGQLDRRYQIDTMTERLMWAGLQAKPRPYRVIIAG